MSLHLIFEHMQQDLAAFIEKCPAPGLGSDLIRVRLTTGASVPTLPTKTSPCLRGLRWQAKNLHAVA
jgi:hypothetical protein